jgi:hypothetical protein|nr:DUF1428 family protein [Phenylobacterium sp.]|tara:strand:- start:20749 stop:21888 length:1140 start_codon:yes stop_codon:yes gene_type:complete
MTYIDGFVIAVPTANRQKFIDHALTGNSVFMELGALRILECWGDEVPEGKQTDFRRAVQATPEETVVFSWIEWPDKATRDAAMGRMEEMMATDPRMNPEINPMPFDGARMIYGGFTPVVTLEAPTANKAGDFIWYELLTTDAAAAQAFYGRVLPWTFAGSGQADMDYRIISAPEHDVAGLMEITPEMAEHGARPVWLSYLAVDDVDAAVDAITQKGGAVQMAAMDVPMVGRMAMVADPQGAPFYVMKPASSEISLAFASDRPRVGHAAWNELHTPDPAGAWAFYGEMFGWVQDGDMDMGPLGRYEFIRHGGLIGAVMPAEAPAWTAYFRVPDIDVAKAAVEAGGGQVVQGPDEIPGGEFSMNCLDPQGAAFGLIGYRKA